MVRAAPWLALGVFAACSGTGGPAPSPSAFARAAPAVDRGQLAPLVAEINKTGICPPACVQKLEALSEAFPDDPEIRATAKQLYLQRQDWQALLRLEERRTPGPRPPAEATELASIQINAGRYQEAAGTLEPLLAAQPGDAELARLAGQVFFHLGEYDRAIPLLDRASAALGGEDGSEAATCRGLIHFYRGETAQAEALLRRAAKLAPGHLPAFNALGRVLAARGAQAESRAAFARAAEIQVAATEAERRQRLLGSLSEMANQAIEQRRYDEGERLIQRMLEVADARQKAQLQRYLADVRKAAGR